MVRGGDKEGIDLLVDPNIAAAEAATAQSCASGNCKAVPATHNLQIRVCISYVFSFSQCMFFLLDPLTTKNQLTNTKCHRKFFVVQNIELGVWYLVFNCQWIK